MREEINFEVYKTELFRRANLVPIYKLYCLILHVSLLFIEGGSCWGTLMKLIQSMYYCIQNSFMQ